MSSIDPESYTPLALTFVQYDDSDPLAKILSLVTLTPIFLLCAYVTIILYRRELTFINALLGQLGCEGLNWALKRSIKQPRPSTLGSGYGMPSSHSQFLGFFAAFFLAHFYLHHPPLAKPRTLINTMRRLEHGIAMLCIATLAVLTCYSRYHLSYHTPAQIFVGFSIGALTGGAYYWVVEHLSRQPLRLPAPLATPTVSPASSPMSHYQPIGNVDSSNSELRHRWSSRSGSEQNTSPIVSPSTSFAPHRRGSSLSDYMPALHPSAPLRQLILDHPIAVALRIRDSWAVWFDGGIEREYSAWRREWERQRPFPGEAIQTGGAGASESRRRRSSNRLPAPVPVLSKPVGTWGIDEEVEDLPSPSASIHLAHLLASLREADRCVPLTTAFCVGSLIASPTLGAVLSTGYSRELPGNTHAEQCALTKLLEAGGSSGGVNTVTATGGGPRPTLLLDLYTTMEPCSERASGNAPCVQRIVAFNAQRPVVALRHILRGGALRSEGGRGDDGDEGDLVELRISRVFQGVREPEDFVHCEGTRLLREAGVEVHTVRPGGGGSRRRRRRRKSGDLGPLETSGSASEEEVKGSEEAWLERECLRIAKKGHSDEPRCRGQEWRRWGASRPHETR